jgi:hypothetical protein
MHRSVPLRIRSYPGRSVRWPNGLANRFRVRAAPNRECVGARAGASVLIGARTLCHERRSAGIDRRTGECDGETPWVAIKLQSSYHIAADPD